MASVVPSSPILVTLMKEALSSSETSVMPHGVTSQETPFFCSLVCSRLRVSSAEEKPERSGLNSIGWRHSSVVLYVLGYVFRQQRRSQNVLDWTVSAVTYCRLLLNCWLYKSRIVLDTCDLGVCSGRYTDGTPPQRVKWPEQSNAEVKNAGA
jgi:hypothetical protein